MKGRMLVALVAAVAVGLAACGSSNDEESAQKDSSAPPAKAKQGGDLTVLYAADVDNIDPGITYYQYGFNVAYATQRPLYSFKPDNAKTPEPDLAEAAPRDLRGRQDRHGQDPLRAQVQPAGQPRGHLQGRRVRDRARLPQDGQRPVRGRLLRRPGRPEGVPGRQGEEDRRDPDAGRHDDRLQARRARAGPIFAGALALPASAPVPREYAAKFDADNPSHVRPPPGRDGPVHDREQRAGQGRRLQRGQGDPAGAQPQLGRQDGLQARLPGLDHDPRGRHTRRRQPSDPRRLQARQRRLPAPGRDPRERLAPAQGPARHHAADRPLPLHRPQHARQAVRQPGRAPCDRRVVRPRRAAPSVRRSAHRRDPHAHHPAGPARLRGGRRREGSRASTSWPTPKGDMAVARST